MEIVPVVRSFSDTLNTLAEAALAESSPIMTSANPWHNASSPQAMSSLLPVLQCFLQKDHEPTILIALPAVLWSNTLTFHGTLPIPLHIQPLLQRSLEPGIPACFPLISFSEKATDENHWVGDTAAKNVSVECLSSLSWSEWESSFTTFKAFFNGGVRILRSINKLLPLCYRFDGYTIFEEVHGQANSSSFSRSAAFRALGLVLHGMDTMQFLDITKLLCWRDAICEAMNLGFQVDLLLNLVRDLARSVFGARAIHSMRSLPGPDEIKTAIDTLNLKQRELETQHQELRALLLAQGVSTDGANCVA
ncbi:unnamed protein product [Prunus armeniaca]